MIRLKLVNKGYAEEENPYSTDEELFHDVKRVKYLRSYLEALADTMRYVTNYAQHSLNILTYAEVLQML